MCPPKTPSYRKEDSITSVTFAQYHLEPVCKQTDYCGNGTYYVYMYLLHWKGIKSTIATAIYWPIVLNLDGDDCGAISGINKWQEKPKCPEKSCSSAALFTTDPT
jgi:hypothetical protein